jgi:hypothetical protein
MAIFCLFSALSSDFILYFLNACFIRCVDAAYIESQGADQPFFICTIQEFRRVILLFATFQVHILNPNSFVYVIILTSILSMNIAFS